MKCIRCQKECQYNQRLQGKCPHCGGQFALEPRASDSLTDGLLEAAVKAVSSEGKVRWHLENLYYEVGRRKVSNLPRKSGPFDTCGGCGCLGMIWTVMALVSGDLAGETVAWMGMLSLAGMGISKMADWSAAAPPRISRETFNKEWSRWAEVHGTPPSMIAAPTRLPSEALTAMEGDLTDYSFDRAVICDLPRTADLLLANNFHFENNCAVLTKDGYPRQAFAAVKSMLKNNPRLKVWVLHDATVEGCTLAHELAHDPEWFSPGAVIIDVGLRPANAKPLEKMWESAHREVEPHTALTEQERQWLGRHSLALAAIRPEQVIKRLFRSMSAGQSSWSDSGASAGFLYVDSDSFSADADTSDGGGDSFG